MDGLKLSYLAVVCLAAIGAVGCGSPVKSEKAQTPPFTIPSGGGDPNNPTPGEDSSDAAGFFVKVLSDTAEITYTHQSDTAYGGDPGTTNLSDDCRIETGDADVDILCIAEVEELDVFFSELTIQYHFPPSMCSYAKFTPYHFYAYEPGDGEANLTVTFDVDGSVVANSAGVNGVTGAPECPSYDYSSSGGPNCCVGEYTLVTTQQNTPDPDTISTSTGEWGGSVGACLSGPGTSESHAGYISADLIPLTKVKYVEGEGLNATFAVLPPIDSDFNGVILDSNLWTANFYEVGDHSAQSPLVLPADRPLALRFPAGLTSTPYLPSDTYRFECHNRAEEIQARIRLMIREWNTSPIAEGGNPEDTAGTDPGFPDGPTNDRRDWFDIGNAYPTTLL